ncbi:MAG TPA: ATP-binding protein [Anaeromyxobacteraceae bacterium]|nr:ATP-binding protein [Anaeromyxobacteraceae bacterium]
MPAVPSLELKLPPEWSAIQRAWEPCRATLDRAGLDEATVYALSMAAQELLENAVKYGDASADISLTLQLSPAEVTIEVRNRVGADEAQLHGFDRAIQWMRGFQDPFEAYVERLKLVSAESYRGGHGGLGLTRIAYEARCLLDFYVDEAGVLAVSAVHALPEHPMTR